jgi:hypothetical protein
VRGVAPSTSQLIRAAEEGRFGQGHSGTLAPAAIPERSEGDGHPGSRLTVFSWHHIRRSSMATKDKNTKKSMEKKPAQKTLKEKRQAKKAKR